MIGSCDQALGLRSTRRDAKASAVDASFIVVASGKGGVGKTHVTANLAVAAAALGARVLVIDGDLGLANVDVVLGLSPSYTAADLLAGRCRLSDALVRGPRGIDLLAAAAGRTEMAALGASGISRLVAAIRASVSYDLVLVDACAGIGPSVAAFAGAAGQALVVLNDEPSSLVDAYATCKVMWQAQPALRLEVIVNGVASRREATASYERLRAMIERFLARHVPMRAILPHDPRVHRAALASRAVVELFPRSPWSREIVDTAAALLRERGLLHSCWRRIDATSAGKPQESAFRS